MQTSRLSLDHWHNGQVSERGKVHVLQPINSLGRRTILPDIRKLYPGTKGQDMILQPVSYAGGKGKLLSRWIYPHFPPEYWKYHYVEPFGGSGAVLLNKPVQNRETLNDSSKLIHNLLTILRADAKALKCCLEATPYGRAEFLSCLSRIRRGRDTFSFPSIEMARSLFVVLQQGLEHRIDTSPGCWRGQGGPEAWNGSNTVGTWLKKIASIPRIQKRLLLVSLECQDWKDVVSRYDSPETFLFLDPPYFGNRVSIYGKEEMLGIEAHQELAGRLRGFTGKVLLCGMPCENHPYDSLGWTRHVTDSRQNLAKSPKQEALWMNYTPPLEKSLQKYLW